MMSIQDLAAYSGKNRYQAHFEKLDPKRQLTVLLDFLGNRHQKRDKRTGYLNKKARATHSFQALTELRSLGYQVKNLTNLGEKHVMALIHSWVEQPWSASTIANRISALRWLTRALGKPGLVRDPAHYGIASERVHRPQATQEDRSWSARDVDVDAKVAAIEQEDPWVGAVLRMMLVFGMRLTESFLFRPGTAVVGNVVRIEDGTKGGRTRQVELTTLAQRDALRAATELAAMSEHGNLIPRGKRPAQQRARIYYVLRKHGITRAKSGCTPHGLRHQYANDRYEGLSGTPSTARGGSEILDAAAEEEAKRVLTNELGHSRVGILSAYLGPPKRKPKPNGQRAAPAGDTDSNGSASEAEPAD